MGSNELLTHVAAVAFQQTGHIVSHEIPPLYCLALPCDPELAIARAKASQDHQKHGVQFSLGVLS